MLMIDLGSYGSTGDQTAYAGKNPSLTAVTTTRSCENVAAQRNMDRGPFLQAGTDHEVMTIIACSCDNASRKLPVITMNPVVIKDRYMNVVSP